MCRAVVTLLLVLFPSLLPAIEPIPRRLPPVGIALKAEDQARLTGRVAALRKRLKELCDRFDAEPLPVPVDLDLVLDLDVDADVEVFLKAVDWAVRFHEFYDEKQLAQADWALQQAEERLKPLAERKTPWMKATGRVVRGYRSRIDGSVQPFVVEIPANLVRTRPVPLFVFLHGRGEKQTDLPFIYERATKASQIAVENAIVVHPFGRQCIGHKSAGEIDVLDVVRKTVDDYGLDPRRVVLMGFSMGGAGAWHIGAHYTDHWCAVAPGAGFSETARFFKLDPSKVAWYEKDLWGVYDVPLYVRNLFNVPVIAYSGEIDGQIQAARVMEEAYAGEGEKLTHLIGPKTAHAYHGETLKELLRRLSEVALAEPKTPTKVHLQTRTLSYNKMHWVTLLGLEEHWKEARVDAERMSDGAATVTTRNVTAMQLDFEIEEQKQPLTLTIDGQKLVAPRGEFHFSGLVRREGKWALAESEGDVPRVGSLPPRPAKTPGLQGPIDDAFRAPFLIVKPSGKSSHPKVQEWVEFELAHAIERWRTVFRGEPRVVLDTEVTDEDMNNLHLVLWGDPESNQVIAKLRDRLPVRWREGKVVLGDRSFDAATHVPVLIYPLRPSPSMPWQRAHKYVVLNSGPTFREIDDANNSQQNPKLPDWAFLDITTPPDAKAAGKVVDAGFFTENWGLKPVKKPE